MKKSILFIILVGLVVFFNACSPGYVSSEPTYLETPRPPRPSANHIWVGDGWVWKRQTHSYSQMDGHWQVPNKGRAYTNGHWDKSPRGHRWVSGQWR